MQRLYFYLSLKLRLLLSPSTPYQARSNSNWTNKAKLLHLCESSVKTSPCCTEQSFYSTQYDEFQKTNENTTTRATNEDKFSKNTSGNVARLNAREGRRRRQNKRRRRSLIRLGWTLTHVGHIGVRVMLLTFHSKYSLLNMLISIRCKRRWNEFWEKG